MINMVSNEYNNFENSVLILLENGATKEELEERLNSIIEQDRIFKKLNDKH